MVLMKLNVTVKHRHILTVVNFILKKKGKNGKMETSFPFLIDLSNFGDIWKVDIDKY